MRFKLHSMRYRAYLTGTSALQAQQQELQRSKITDSLKKNLANRPEKDELVQRTCMISYILSNAYHTLLP